MYRSHVLVCGGAGCSLAGGKDIFMALETEIEKNGLTDEVSIVQTSCHGMCALGPLMIVHPEGSLYTKLTVENIKEIVEEHLINGRVVGHLLYNKEAATKDTAITKDTSFNTPENSDVIEPENMEEYLANGGYEELGRVLFELKPKEAMTTMKDIKLTGRGGIDFTIGTDWQTTLDKDSNQACICCTATKDGFGRFVEQSVLEYEPYIILEAMAIAGYALGAAKGCIHVPGQASTAIEHLTTALEQAREYGYLGENIFGTEFAFDIELAP
jgi:NADP-reducing hydrogenase subunit HndC